ncbi:MAG: alpha/beta fold hydrolase [Bacteroidota bacterium]
MPIIQSNFQPKRRIFRNMHVSTIYASLIRRWIPDVAFNRERLELSDGDFLDLDWSKVGNKKLIIVLAGLEGKSKSMYARAAIKHFNDQGWDALGLNYRGCSGEPNRLLRGYHMGASEDVKVTVEHAIRQHGYEEVVLIGYSLGGNLALKYIGEESHRLPSQVKASVVISAPMDLEASERRMNRWYNWHYVKWFMLTLNWKANRKKRQYPEALKSYRGFFMSGNFIYFDTHFTAPANGFPTVEDYWEQSSCRPYLKNIQIPTLIVATENDTFLSDNCYPIEAAKQNPNLFLEIPKTGGHCAFIRYFNEKVWWMEERAFQFVQSFLPSKKVVPKVKKPLGDKLLQ